LVKPAMLDALAVSEPGKHLAPHSIIGGNDFWQTGKVENEAAGAHRALLPSTFLQFGGTF